MKCLYRYPSAEKKQPNGSRPTIIRNLRNINAIEKDYVRLDCFLIGEPEPEITWFHNELAILNDDRKIIVNKDDQYSLIINQCEPEDFGDYKIIAKNSFGDAQSQCRLNVQVISRKQAVPTQSEHVEPPRFVEDLTDIKILEGYDACFKCKVSSKAPYEVKWFKDGKLLVESNRIKINVC